MRIITFLIILVIIPCIFFVLLHKVVKCLKYIKNVFAEIIVPQTISIINGDIEKDEFVTLSESQKKTILNNPFFGYSDYKEDSEDQEKKKSSFSSKIVLIVCGIVLLILIPKILLGILSIVKLMYF